VVATHDDDLRNALADRVINVSNRKVAEMSRAVTT
jgi:ABC-type lipoprotein export system ATPase subunit